MSSTYAKAQDHLLCARQHAQTAAALATAEAEYRAAVRDADKLEAALAGIGAALQEARRIRNLLGVRVRYLRGELGAVAMRQRQLDRTATPAEGV